VSPRAIRAVLFDMDGTLVDTLPDIAAAVNLGLAELGLDTLEHAHIATLIGNGPRMLSRGVLEAQPALTAEQRHELVDQVLACYARHYATQAGSLGRVFPGARECLRELRGHGLQLGVVTNALQHLAETVLARFGLTPYLHSIVGGDRVAKHKPHPDPLWHACAEFGVAPEETLMVGDSVTDVAAASAAGCAIVCVPHGYDQGRSVHELGVDVIADLWTLPAWIAALERQLGNGTTKGTKGTKEEQTFE
jgi:phosphoglycolate phosphatase